MWVDLPIAYGDQVATSHLLIHVPSGHTSSLSAARDPSGTDGYSRRVSYVLLPWSAPVVTRDPGLNIHRMSIRE